MQNMSLSMKGKNYSMEENNECSKDEEAQDKSVNYRRWDVLKVVKQKKKNREQQRGNSNIFPINKIESQQRNHVYLVYSTNKILQII